MHARNFGSMPMYRAWHRASLITWKMASRSSLTWREWQRTSTNQRLLDSLQTVEQAGAQVDLHDRGDQCEVLFWRTSWTEEECASQCCSHWQSRCRSKAAQPCTLHRSCAKWQASGGAWTSCWSACSDQWIGAVPHTRMWIPSLLYASWRQLTAYAVRQSGFSVGKLVYLKYSEALAEGFCTIFSVFASTWRKTNNLLVVKENRF